MTSNISSKNDKKSPQIRRNVSRVSFIFSAVSIELFLTIANKNPLTIHTMQKSLATIHHLDLYGRRQPKYDALESLTLSSIDWAELIPANPYYFFIPKNTDGQEEYESGF